MTLDDLLNGKIVLKNRLPKANLPRINFLKNKLLTENHRLSFPFLDPFLFQLFAGVHLPCGSRLTGTDLAEPALTEDPIHPGKIAQQGWYSFKGDHTRESGIPKSLVRDGLSFKPLPLEITVEVHRVQELLERVLGEVGLDFVYASTEKISLT